MRRWILLLALALSACASTEMRGFVGKPIDEAFIAYGRPENTFELSDGRRAYQFRWGGGAVVTPGRAISTGATVGNVTTVTTTATPAMIYESAGCLITFIARDKVIEEYRIPRQLVC